MDLDQLKVIYDSQTEEPLFAVDAEALRAKVQRQSRQLSCGASVEELGMVLICLGTAAGLAAEPFFEGTDHYQYASALLFAGVAAYMLLSRRSRRRREAELEPSLRGELARALLQVQGRIRRARTFAWWFLVPAGLTIVLSAVVGPEPKSTQSWLIAAGGFTLSLIVVEASVRCALLPLQRRLRALDNTLSELD